jgi:predicted RecA/RadA family phage recombinase
MSRTFIQKGDTVTIAAAAAIKSGDLVVQGSLAGIAQTDAAVGAAVEIVLVGVHELPKVAGTALNAGAKAWWDAVAKNVVGAGGTGKAPIGTVTETAGSTAVVCRVRLDGISTAVA